MKGLAGTTIELPSGELSVLNSVGRGGSSEVWAARRGEARYALKVATPGAESFVASEGERLALACSRHLPLLVEAGVLSAATLGRKAGAPAPYLLLSWVGEESLADVLKQGLSDPERHDLARSVARDVGAALADLHESGVAHGDVKPDNVLVERVAADDLGFRCTLIDLGLAGLADTDQLTGATLRYLPPEYRFGSGTTATDARSRDVWALGLTLLEIFGPQSDPSTPTVTALTNDLKPLVGALLAPSANARPRPRWLAQQVGYRSTSQDRQLAIRRCYLAAQRSFLAQVARGAEYQISIPGTPGRWLHEACRVLSSLATLPTTTPRAPLATADPLSAERQRQFVVGLCGLAGIDLPPLPFRDDEQLIERLLEATRYHALEGVSLATLLANDSSAVELRRVNAPTTAADLALELGGERPTEQVLELAEKAVFDGEASLAFTLRLAGCLKRLGELGRAQAVLLTRSEPQATLERMGVLARSGAVDAALEQTQALLQQGVLNPASRAAAGALLARLHLTRGDSDHAIAAVHEQLEIAEVLEAKASIALVRGELESAEAWLARARAVTEHAEQQARVESLGAHLAHQRGDHQRALAGYQRAAEYAVRAGAVVEEATYLVGVASTAAHLAQSEQALNAAQRAETLFEFLNNPAASARAALSRASTLSVLGARVEGSSAAFEAIARAHSAGDARCEAYAHLVLCEQEPLAVAVEHVDAAQCLLHPLRNSDRLRLAAARLRLTGLSLDARSVNDALALAEPDVEVRLEWWRARAGELVHATTLDGEGARPVLEALQALASSGGPVEAVGRAFAVGAELAARSGDGELCLRFTALARAAHERIVQHAPSGLKLAARQVEWAAWLVRQSSPSVLHSEQISEVERLVRTLADRSRLRPILDRTLDALVRWTGVERGLLLLKAPEGRLVPRAARNLARRDLSMQQLELSRSLAQRALESGDCVVAVDASGELAAVHHSVHALRLRSVLAVPLIAHGDTLGVVYLDDRVRRGAFGEAELSWVRLVASIASVAIADARDQTLLRRAVRRAERAERQTSERLSRTANELSQAKAALHAQRSSGAMYPMLVGTSAGMAALKRLLDRVAGSDVPVLLAGESGTGKELVARAIHGAGARKDEAFVSENCSAIPESLLETTLFGHQKGAFTGATHNHAGLFELAHRGTLFLDEVGEMSLPMQAKLLRVLESGELRRVGGERSIRVNVRILGASHKDIARLVEQGKFREDLYYRLNVVTLRVPALRERLEDIPELVAHFLAKHSQSGDTAMTPAALAALQHYHWPGNVRQLENEIRRALVLCDGHIGMEHLSEAIAGSTAALHPSASSLSLRQHVDRLEARLIEQALRDTQGNQTRAAEVLGISRFGLQKMLKRLNIELLQ